MFTYQKYAQFIFQSSSSMYIIYVRADRV